MAYIITVINEGHKTQFKSLKRIDTTFVAFTENLDENWPRYNDTVIEI